MKQENLSAERQIELSSKACPNCWGYQEYGGVCIKSMYTKSLGWIQEYFNKFLKNHR
jgi:hypothetical protein